MAKYGYIFQKTEFYFILQLNFPIMYRYSIRLSATLFLFLTFFFGACNTEQAGKDNEAGNSGKAKEIALDIPSFDANKAYAYIQKQVEFGPRVPGTAQHKACAIWLEEQLRQSCDTVYKQDLMLPIGDGSQKPCINLIGSFRPEAENRILFLAHWDTRPWADQDTKEQHLPILGADDGGSGTAVLLHLAEIIKEKQLPEGWGVDILLADLEDYGKTEWGDKSYAIGTQYWASHPHVSGYIARAGILLDMVGAKNARFPLEGFSRQHAPFVQKEIWKAASDAGYSSYFVYDQGGHITDDHVPVNETLNIPTIDIINLPSSTQTGFGSHWHTHQDNLNVIDQRTLKAVGQTILQYLYTKTAS